MRFSRQHIVSLFLTFLGISSLTGQEVTSQAGRFKVDYGRGCNPLPVIVTNLFGGFSGAPQYDYEFDSDFFYANLVLDTFHTYQSVGLFTLLQEGPQVRYELIDSLIIQVFEPLTPEFEVSACANNTAKVIIADTYYDQFRVFYTATDSFDVSQGQDVPAFTYPGPGTYNVKVEGFFDNAQENCASQITPFTTGNDTIVPAQVISADVSAISDTDGSVVLHYSLTSGTSYRVERTNANRTGPFIQVGLAQDPSSTTVSGLNTRDFYYCFRIVAFEACSGQSFASDTVCSTTLGVTAREGANDLSWSTGIVNFANYQLFKDSTLAQAFSSASSSTYSDENIPCNREICYSLVTNYTNGITSSVSNVCITSLSGDNPPLVDNIMATYNESSIDLSWDKASADATEFYAVFRSIKSGPAEFLDSTAQNSYSDSGVDPDKRYCYRISYRDECGNESDLSTRSCPIQVRRSSELLTMLELSWSQYLGWSAGVRHYVVEELDEQGNITNSSNVGLSRTFEQIIDQSGSQVKHFRIRAESEDSNPLVSFSLLLEIRLESQVFLPNAFYPEGLNKRLEVNTYFVTEYEMKVFNRWGEIIHASDQNGRGWDGTIANTSKRAAKGSYIYRIDFQDQASEPLQQSGSVMLIR